MLGARLLETHLIEPDVLQDYVQSVVLQALNDIYTCHEQIHNFCG
jgi:hypothetical protein